jgi:hypothetical protein
MYSFQNIQMFKKHLLLTYLEEDLVARKSNRYRMMYLKSLLLTNKREYLIFAPGNVMDSFHYSIFSKPTSTTASVSWQNRHSE